MNLHNTRVTPGDLFALVVDLSSVLPDGETVNFTATAASSDEDVATVGTITYPLADQTDDFGNTVAQGYGVVVPVTPVAEVSTVVIISVTWSSASVLSSTFELTLPLAYGTRTTPEQVGSIIELDEEIRDIYPFIEPAAGMVSTYCLENGYSDATLELIERWLSAHFYAQRDPRVTSEAAKGVSASYQSSVALGLNNTHYGQMAMRLDTGGNLAAAEAAAQSGKRRSVSVLWLGKE